MFKKQLNEGQAGDNVGLLLRGIKRDDVVRGQVTDCARPRIKGLGFLRKLQFSLVLPVAFARTLCSSCLACPSQFTGGAAWYWQVVIGTRGRSTLARRMILSYSGQSMQTAYILRRQRDAGRPGCARWNPLVTHPSLLIHSSTRATSTPTGPCFTPSFIHRLVQLARHQVMRSPTHSHRGAQVVCKPGSVTPHKRF